jgi:hypothetical protein
MNHTTLALVAVLAAAALVIGTFASPAFAGATGKGTNTTKRTNTEIAAQQLQNKKTSNCKL